MALTRMQSSTIEDRFRDILAEPVWVCWSEIERAGRKVKLPINPLTGRSASVSDPSTWTRYDQATRRRRKTGIGVMLTSTRAGHLVGVDLDTCRDRVTGTLDEWVADVLETIPSYAEISPSGTGLKIFALMSDEQWEQARVLVGAGVGRLGAAWKAPGEHHPPGVELYLGGRYFTVTGNACGDQRLLHLRAEHLSRLIEICDRMFVKPASAVKTPPRHSNRGRDVTESGRAFAACLAAIRAGVPVEDVPEWASRQLTAQGQGLYGVSNEYWSRMRGEGSQLSRDFARALALVSSKSSPNTRRD